MKYHAILNAALGCLLLAAGQAQAGYWHNASGEVWRNSAGECWRTGYWTEDAKVVGCDGMTAPAPVVKPMATPEPEPAPAPMAVEPVNATVNFDFDSADLNAQAAAAVNSMLSAARTEGQIRSVRLTGHADRIGTEAYNLALSLRRASAVSDYLVRQTGMDPQRIEIGGKGESEPLVGCEGTYGAAAIRCLAPNRRVDMVLDLF